MLGVNLMKEDGYLDDLEIRFNIIFKMEVVL